VTFIWRGDIFVEFAIYW